MDYYKKILTGTVEAEKKQMVFALIYSKKGQPFSNYSGIPEEIEVMDIPVVLMLLRTDGALGFVGGKVEEGETLVGALCREVKEEIGYDLELTRIEPIITHQTSEANIHAFGYEIEGLSQLREIQAEALKAEHFPAETGGCIMVKIINFGEGLGYHEFLKNNFCATARIELETLVQEKNLLVSIGELFW